MNDSRQVVKELVGESLTVMDDEVEKKTDVMSVECQLTVNDSLQYHKQDAMTTTKNHNSIQEPMKRTRYWSQRKVLSLL